MGIGRTISPMVVLVYWVLFIFFVSSFWVCSYVSSCRVVAPALLDNLSVSQVLLSIGIVQRILFHM